MVCPGQLPPAEMMRLEHDQHGLALARMAELAHGPVEPPDACNTARAVQLRTLREDLMQHIHLEK